MAKKENMPVITINGRQYIQDIFEEQIDGLVFRDAIVIPVEDYNLLSHDKVKKLKDDRTTKYTPRKDKAWFGMATHLEWLSDTELNIQLDLLQAMGCKYVRNDFSIAIIEPTEGIFDWAKYDNVVNSCTAHGIEMIALMDQYNSVAWCNGNNTKMYHILPQYYQSWCEETAKHYNGKIKIFEIGNEPNGVTFWPPYPDPVAYTELLKAGHTGTKAGNPNSIVLLAGLAGQWTVRSDTFLAGVYANGGKGYFDGVAHHPYTRPGKPDFNTGYLDACRAVMIENGDEDLPVYITEVGWPTGLSAISVSEATQAGYVNELFNLANGKNYKYVKMVCWYTFKDYGTNLTDPESNYGLIHSHNYSTPYQPKPSYYAYQALTN